MEKEEIKAEEAETEVADALISYHHQYFLSSVVSFVFLEHLLISPAGQRLIYLLQPVVNIDVANFLVFHFYTIGKQGSLKDFQE